ncbi:MAG: hypothetical protein O2960_03310, partial [Verrucomicrobia bacterium]|nr:hypothetical protein [Verrucomicrobiota bacterium]
RVVGVLLGGSAEGGLPSFGDAPDAAAIRKNHAAAACVIRSFVAGVVAVAKTGAFSANCLRKSLTKSKHEGRVRRG